MAGRRKPGTSVYLDEQTKAALLRLGWKRWQDRELGTIARKILEAAAAADSGVQEVPASRPVPTHRRRG